MRLDEPVSKITVNSCGGVPTEIVPKYDAWNVKNLITHFNIKISLIFLHFPRQTEVHMNCRHQHTPQMLLTAPFPIEH